MPRNLCACQVSLQSRRRKAGRQSQHTLRTAAGLLHLLKSLHMQTLCGQVRMVAISISQRKMPSETAKNLLLASPRSCFVVSTFEPFTSCALGAEISCRVSELLDAQGGLVIMLVVLLRLSCCAFAHPLHYILVNGNCCCRYEYQLYSVTCSSHPRFDISGQEQTQACPGNQKPALWFLVD